MRLFLELLASWKKFDTLHETYGELMKQYEGLKGKYGDLHDHSDRLLEAYRDLERSSARLNRRDFQRLMTERIATHPDAPLYEMQWMDWLDDGLTPKLA